jgi:uncharacterized delta-60 repeat protein
MLNGGSLDLAFGRGGTAITDFQPPAPSDDAPAAVLVQPDQKTVVFGYSSNPVQALDLARYNLDGTLDATFGNGGLVTTFFANSGQALAGTLQSDGKIVVAGSIGMAAALIRYNANGTLDTSFHGLGWTTLAVGRTAYANGIALLPSGRFIVSGTGSNSAGRSVFFVSRFTATGDPDPTFGTGGVVTTDFNNATNIAHGLALQSDGKIILAGEATKTSSSDIAVVRLNPNGSLDTTFGTGGKTTIDLFGSDDRAFSVALQDDKILLTGDTYNPAVGSFQAVLRLNSNGSRDISFGKSGVVTRPFSDGVGVAFSVGLQPGGKIVTGSYSQNVNGKLGFGFARYNNDGTPDSSFGAGGIVLSPIGSSSSGARAMEVLSDGRFVAVGDVAKDFAIARYQIDGTLDPTFNAGAPELTNFPFANVLSSRDYAYSLVQQPDGKLLAAGYSDSAFSGDAFSLARYNLNGNLDSSFGQGGKVLLNLSFAAAATPLALRLDGKILQGGAAFVPNATAAHTGAALVQYNPDGSLDTNWGNGGMVLLDIEPNASSAIQAMGVQSDGSIVAAGFINPSFNGFPADHNFAIWRYNPDGTQDLNFGGGTGGFVFYDFGGTSFQTVGGLSVRSDDRIVISVHGMLLGLLANGLPDPAFSTVSSGAGGILALAPDGKILTANRQLTGGPNGQPHSDFVINRYLADGTFDDGFGIGGIATFDLGDADTPSSIAFASDRRIVIGGYTKNYSDSLMENFAVLRLSDDGTLDPTFGAGGSVCTALDSPAVPTSGDIATQVIIQADGNIALAGITSANDPAHGGSQYNNFVVARYLAATPLTARIVTPATIPEETKPVKLDGSTSTNSAGPIAKYEWDLNHTSCVFHVDSTGPTATITPSDNGTRHVALRITDAAGVSHTTIATVLVINVPPTIGPLPNLTVGAGGTLTVNGSFTDPGADTWKGTVDWGDGSPPQNLTIDASKKTFQATKVFPLPGVYTAIITIQDKDGGIGTASVVVRVSGVVGASMFYNNSAFDGNDPAANAADDNSIAPDKTVLLPGRRATFSNYTSYSKGINGLMIDVRNLANAAALSAADFAFKIGNDNSPQAWPVAPAPSSILVRNGAGVADSDRIELVWPDYDPANPTSGGIGKTWLEVTVLPTANTGLTVPQVFYFGNAIGETGNSAANARVTDIDSQRVHDNFAATAAITNTFDFNRDQQADAADEAIAQNNTTGLLGLRLITPIGLGSVAAAPVVVSSKPAKEKKAKTSPSKIHAAAGGPTPYQVTTISIPQTGLASLVDANGILSSPTIRADGGTGIAAQPAGILYNWNETLFVDSGGAADTVLLIKPGTSIPLILTVGGSPFYSASSFTPVGNQLYFYSASGAGPGTYVTDGTSAGTHFVHTGTPAGVVGSHLFISDSTGLVGQQLNIFVTDGTSGGTHLVHTGRPLGSSGPYLFFADTVVGPPYTPSFWRTDGTPGGTLLLKNNFYAYGGAELNGTFILGGEEADSSFEGLWTSDGTIAGTTFLTPGGMIGDSENLKVSNILYYQLYSNVGPGRIWRTDGTAGGTFQIGAAAQSNRFGAVHNLASIGDYLYFTGYDAKGTAQLLRTDSSGNVVTITHIGIDPSFDYVYSGLAAVDGKLYVGAAVRTQRHQLWISDGTPGNQTLIGNIPTSDDASGPDNLTSVAGSLYFTITDNRLRSSSLWRMGVAPAIVDNGVLVINGIDAAEGGSGNDAITLASSGGMITVSVNGSNFQFADDQLSSILINGLSGNDALNADASVTKPILFNGDAGKDSFTFTGTDGDDSIDTGSNYVSNGTRLVLFTDLDSLAVNSLGGNDTVLAHGTPAATNIDCGDGEDSVSIGDGVLSSFAGQVTVSGGNGDNDLTIDDALNFSGDPYIVTANSIARPNFSGVKFNGISAGVILETGSAGNLIALTPGKNSEILIDGGLPITPASTRDRLKLDLSDATNPRVTQSGINAGQWTFDNVQIVYFTGIERSDDGLGATFSAVTPSPRITPVDKTQVTFTGAVTGFDVSDLSLTRDGGPNLLTTAQKLTSTDGLIWTLGDLRPITRHSGLYTLSFNPLAADAALPHDSLGSPPATDPSTSWRKNPATVNSRLVFYNDSSYDGNDPLAGASDNAAIATDKRALLPGQKATFANYTSYLKGINGIIVDVTGLENAAGLSLADFTFRAGNSSDPSAWAVAPVPSSVSVRPGAGAGGSDRITLIWPNNAIQKQWLQIAVLANDNTGLDAPDVFYFGNAIGESGDRTTDAAVNARDALAARSHAASGPVALTNAWDFNRDGQVSIADVLVAQSNMTAGSAVLSLIRPTANAAGQSSAALLNAASTQPVGSDKPTSITAPAVISDLRITDDLPIESTVWSKRNRLLSPFSSDLVIEDELLAWRIP